MSKRTDTRVGASEINLRMLSGFLAACAVLVLVMALHRGWWMRVERIPDQTPAGHVPPVEGMRILLEGSLRVWNTGLAEPMSSSTSAELLGVSLFFLVLVPTGFALLLRRRLLNPFHGIPRVRYLMGIGIPAVVSLCLPLVAINSRALDHRSRLRMGVQRTNEVMRDEIDEIMNEAMIYCTLEANEHDGGKSFRGFGLPQRFVDAAEGRYTVTVLSGELRVFGVPRRNPLSRYADIPPGTPTDAAIEVSVDTAGTKSAWKEHGLFVTYEF
jgi:hypothetical protein